MWQDGFTGRIERDVSLAGLTTIRIGGRARWFVRPRDADETGRLLAALAAEGLSSRVLGGGSNLLAPDRDLEEVVIHPSELTGFSVDGPLVRVGAGVPLSNLVARASDASLRGVQVLAGIPGQVGGAVAMNAGGRYGEIGQVIAAVLVREADGRPATLAPEELRFGYRHAELPPGSVVTDVILRLEPVQDRRALKQEAGRILKEKNEAQPTTGWNFGCMFKNPPGRSAGRILDEVGMKGAVRGGARVSPKHANFVENMGEARAEDVRWLLEECERRAVEVLGIRLEREVRVW